jgi:arabinofuranosyltransferase
MSYLPFMKKKNSKLLLVYLAVGNLWLLLLTWRQTFNVDGNRTLSLFDDALISMTYARTFSQTGELVWFPGANKIQGITNPLWTLVLSLLHLISDNPKTVIYLVIAFGFITINISAILVYKILGLILPVSRLNTAIQIAAAVSIPFQYSYVYWTLRGLEVGILSLVLLVTIFIISKNANLELFSKDYLMITLLGFIGTAIRFDYILIHIVVVIFLTAFKKLNFLNKSKILKILSILAPLFTITLVILGWQKMYYGEFLPNTYYLKVSGFEIHSRITRGFFAILKSYLTPIVLLLLTIYVLSKKQLKNSIREIILLSCSVFFAVICYVIYIGGDAWEVYGKINRFLSVVQPLLIITIGMGIHLLLSLEHKILNSYKWLALPVIASSLGYGIRINPVRYSAIFVFVVLLIYLLVYFSTARTRVMRYFVVNLIFFFVLSSNSLAFASWLQSGAKDGLDVLDQQNYQIALDIEKILYNDGKVAVIFAGAPVYFSNRPGIDLLGKNDAYIANQQPNFDDFIGEWNSSFYPGHNKWDFNYSIGYLKPDMVAQSWGKTPIQDFGYKKFCLIGTNRSYFFNSKSKNIKWSELKQC